MTHGGGGVAAAENQGAVEGGAGLPAQDVGQLGATSPVRLGNVQVGNAALADPGSHKQLGLLPVQPSRCTKSP